MAGGTILAKPHLEEDPPYRYPAYQSTALRGPNKTPLILRPGSTELHAPVFGSSRIRPNDDDLTAQHAGEPLGEKIVISGRLLDSNGRPIPNQLVEIWQANSSGRYAHLVDDHAAPLDPNFTGGGRTITDKEGRYRFTTIKPAAYPWGNHPNAWRPAHVHFSLFGAVFTQRLITQMYFPGDPLIADDPIANSIRDKKVLARLISAFDWDLTIPGTALGYRWDIVLGGSNPTPEA
ncbi:MAG: protocatechuate 3,4-dioxygenase subunit beta [Acidimicrobiaceae bacterium]|nr:protocatechuate 3,4-dioxygenase subunit beta [Acidimicrobiaceae bacterium]